MYSTPPNLTKFFRGIDFHPMSNSYEQGFIDFESLLSRWNGAYIRSIHSYVAVKRQEENHLLVGRIFLEPIRDEVNEASVQFETESIVAGRFVKVMTLDSLTELLVSAKAGRMDTDRGPISLLVDPPGSISASFAPICHPLISDGPRLPSLIIHGSHKHDVLKLQWDHRQN